MKAAVSLDGKIAARGGDSKWISCVESRDLVQRMRFEADAILVGAGTVLHDDPRLTVRLKGLAGSKRPLRVVLDWNLDVGPGARLYRDHEAPVLVVTSQQAPEHGAARLREKGVEVLRLLSPGARADLKRLLRELASRNVLHLLVEGGSEVFGSFRDASLYDELQLFVAPILIGGSLGRPLMGGEGARSIRSAHRVEVVRTGMVGTDIHVVARRKV